MTKLLLAGATGLVGGEAPALSLADERVTQVVAPTRRQLAPHPKLFNPIVETGNLQLAADWWAVDGGLCAIGTTRAKTPSTAAYRAIGFDYALAIARRIPSGKITRSRWLILTPLLAGAVVVSTGASVSSTTASGFLSSRRPR